MLRHRGFGPVLAIVAAASVSILAVLPRAHVHEESTRHSHPVIHRHFEESAPASGESLEHSSHHQRVRYLESVFTKLSRFHVAPPLVARALSPAHPDERFVGHIELQDAHPIRGAPLPVSTPRAPPLRLSQAR